MKDKSKTKEQLIKEITEMRKRVAELEEPESKTQEDVSRDSKAGTSYQVIFDSIGDAIHIIDRELRIIFANRAFAEWIKVMPIKTDIVGLNVFEAFPFLQETVRDEYEQVFKTGKPLITEECNILDGRKIYTESRKIPVMEEYRVVQIITVIRDITNRKQAEGKLRESEEQYRNIFENANEAIMVAQDGKLVFFNQMTVSLLGYSSEELASRPFVDFIHQDDREKIYNTYLKRIEGREVPFRHSYRAIHKNGNIRWVERNAVLIDWKGKSATLNFLSDITERKQAEEALTNNEAQLRKEQKFSQLLLDASPALIVAIGFDGKTLMMNKALLDTIEYTAEEIKETDYVTTFVPEEDRGMLSDVFRKIIQERITTVNENRIISKSGRTYLIEWHGMTVSHEAEGSGFFVGVGIDITTRKKMEETLRQSEERYRTILEDIEEGYFEMDLAGNATYFNDSICLIFGYPREELMGMNYKQYTDKENGKKCFQIYNKVYKTGKADKVYDYEIIRKDGTTRNLEMTCPPKTDPEFKLGLEYNTGS